MMHDQDRETLSAMLDNEADELELRRILQATGKDPQLADTWQRMSLVQALLHDDNLKVDSHLAVDGDKLSSAVMQAIEEEPILEGATSDGQGNRQQWTLPLAKMGIAASVALAFFLGMQTTVSQSGDATAVPLAQQPGVESGTSVEASPSLLATSDTPSVRQVDPEARQRLEEYIQSVSITREEPEQLEQLQDSPLYRLVNEVRDSQ